MEFIGTLYDGFIAVFTIAFILLGVIAVARVAYLAKKGKKIEITPVGAMRDLPSSITGIPKEKEEIVEVRERDGE